MAGHATAVTTAAIAMTAPPSPEAPAQPPRQVFLDWLRIAALLTLVPYHVGMYYVPWPWHVKSATIVPELAPWMMLTSPWRMSLLFLVSGAALSLALQRWAAGQGWLRDRARKLMWPLLTGILLVVPLQPYFEVRQFHGYGGGFGEFLLRYYSADAGFCRPGRGCLVLPTWNHLWYLPYLMAYTLGLWGQLRRWPLALDRMAARLTPWLSDRLTSRLTTATVVFVLPVAWLLATRVAMGRQFPPSHALVDDWMLHSQYAPIFLLGAVLARCPPAWPRAEALRWTALGIAAVAWALLVSQPALPLWRAGAASAMQWCGIVAALGFGHRHLHADGPWRQALSQAVFPVYLLHQSVTIGLAMALAPARLPIGVEALLLVTGTLALGACGWLATRRWPRLAPWLGGAPAARPAQPASRA
jgi:hypothetical protein